MSGGHNVSSVAERHGGGGGARAIIVPSKPLLYPGLIWCSLQSLSYGQRAARPVAPGERLKSARGSILRPGMGRGSRNAICMENPPLHMANTSPVAYMNGTGASTCTCNSYQDQCQRPTSYPFCGIDGCIYE